MAPPTDTARLARATLALHLARGDMLLARGARIVDSQEYEAWREQRRIWARACGQAIAEAFEPEAVLEFAHALMVPVGTSSSAEPSRTELDATQRAIELLRALQATL